MECFMAHADMKKNGSHHERKIKRWTFITNYASVLLLVSKHPQITAREIAQVVGITERAVRLIINDLHIEGYIRKTREGRGVKYAVDSERSMRHKTQQGVAVKHLLSIMTKEPRFVLGVADQVPPDGLERRVKRVSELVEEFGRYK